MKINLVKKRASKPTMAFLGLMLFVLMIIMVGQNQLFFFSRLHSFIDSTPRTISHKHGGSSVQKSKSIISCDRSHYFYDICSINGPTIFDPFESTFSDMDPTNKNNTNITVEKIRPYPRKWENFTMGRIKEITLTTGPLSPTCLIQHKAQALVFSVGGYTGNFFHDINDGFLPLFITVNSLFPNQDFIFVISKLEDWWVQKYKDLLQSFSKHPIINLDKEINVTHCFPKATLGLMSHGFMTIDPKLTPTSKTLIDFHKFLATTYGAGHKPLRTLSQPQPQPRPQLVLASRNGSVGRLILNHDEVKLVAEQIGFEVILFEPSKNTSLHESFGLIHSSHAMIGVHGAALTHALFLRPSSIFIQIIPIGAEGVSDLCFGKIARDMKLVYEEYKIGIEESSLVDKFAKEDSLVLKNPKALQENGWSKEIMDIYLREQNIKLDLNRFRMYLKRAYRKAKAFMAVNG
ncbi:xylan glycosyltransferase MUCI21 [Nicotiana tabacum]|uniref:xylan glycosyltransferase MUCI21 n=1 Tax=Nicotiana tabacum TaxID=4097 RepID=UPI003F4ED50E